MSFAHYETIERLSKGAVSEVWKAYRSDLELPVALKLFSPDEAMEDGEMLDWQALFLNEAAVLPWLHHPSILRFYDLAYGDAGEMAIVTELIGGRCLVGLTATFEQAGMIAVRVLGAIQYLQRPMQIGKRLYPAIIHGDIKPSNIMLTGDGVRLIDFGFACPDPELNDKKILGTPRFASPRRLAGEEPSWRDDVYSLAVTMFDIVGMKLEGGRLPDHLKHPIAKIFRKMLKDEYQQIGEIITAITAHTGSHNYGPEIAALAAP